jgi:hypothetical protein
MKGSGAFKIRLWLVLSVLGTPLARLRSRSAARSLLSRRAAFTTALAMTLACLGGLTAASPASAETETLSPWWSVTTNARPTYLHSGVAQDEVQEILTTQGTVFGIAEQTDFVLKFKGTKLGPFPGNGEFGTKKVVETYPTEVVLLTHENLQKALEEPDAYGPNNVTVQETGEAANGEPLKAGEKRYLVTTVGALADKPVSIEDQIEVENVGSTALPKVAAKAKTDGRISISLANIGDAPTAGAGGAPITIADRLPAGVTAINYESVTGENGIDTTTCELPPATPEAGEVLCTYAGPIKPFEQIEVTVDVNVTAGAHPASEPNEVNVSGGGAPSVSLPGNGGVAPKVVFSTAPVPFGIERYAQVPEEAGGSVDTQAGSHPFQDTGTVVLNQVLREGQAQPAQLSKDIVGELPAGLIGNPNPIPHCSIGQFLAIPPNEPLVNECSAGSAVGVAMITVYEPGELLGEHPFTFADPIFNLAPEEGEPARFGFLLPGTPIFLDTSVRSGRDYGVDLGSHNISQTAGLDEFRLTFWGTPGEAAHNGQRGPACLGVSGAQGACNPLEAMNPPPFLALPASCQVNQTTLQPEELKNPIVADSWLQPNNFKSFEGELEPALEGCNRLPFAPEITVEPNSHAASTASGIDVDVHVPQAEALNATGVAPAEPRDITVALPPGVAVNPSGGNGLEACTGALGVPSGTPGNEIGFEGFTQFNPDSEPGVQTSIFSGYFPGSIPAQQAIGEGLVPAKTFATLEPGVDFCPNAAKVAKVKIKTPILPGEIEGAAYIATQNQNPFGSLLAMYVVAEDKEAGVLVKLVGNVTLCKNAGEPVDGMTCEANGQLITRFENSPQAPFEDAKFEFFGGERSPLTTPSRCGSYTTKAAFTSWSAKPRENEAHATVHASSTFPITEGPNGTPCPGASLPFSPSLTGGALNVNAGAFSPFTLTMTRHDGEQNLQSVEAHLPPGMSGYLSNVAQCPEPQANLGECPENSLIGEATVSVGVGSDPYTVSGGKFYLTGPYNGSGSCAPGPADPGCAPFGVTFEVPAKAGPFDLERNSQNPAGEDPCDCVLVRGKIEVNKETAAITVTSNPPGTPDAIPTSLEGIPLEIQKINATTTRGNFQFNPTNCNKLEATGTIHSTENNTDTLGVPFQVTNCAALKFEPKVAISTSGKTSKAEGASLTYKLTYPNVAQGTDADIHYVKVELPKQLPSRLTTLQKACTAAQFKANPAGCPAESVIGHAKANVPNIPVPLEGPVYFVSNGGEAFPNLVIVLQGYNVTIDLVGDTFISKSGITSTTFKTVPDNPVYSFEINLPEGKYSALAANGNLCKLTTTKTVTKKVKVKVKGREKTVTRKVKETVTAALQMPNEYIAQNGMKINTTVPISVTGCTKAKAAKKVKRKAKHSKKGRK